MPPKKANSKKAQSKVIQPADAEVFNNGEKEVVPELANDANILVNGNSLKDVDDLKGLTKSKTTKRATGRAKNVPDLDVEVPSSKKPAAKGRAKKMSNENEVIENESDAIDSENQEVSQTKADEEIKTKPKGRGGGKKAEPKIKNNSKAKDKKDTTSDDGVQEEDSNKEETKPKVANTKNVTERKEKKNISKTQDQVEEKQAEEVESVKEKPSKAASRTSKKVEEIAVEVEPQKKKARAAKKEKIVEKSEDEIVVADVKEKKPTKRGRNASKAVITTEEVPYTNGDTEEVLPKKRSRKAPSVEKEILKEKPKKGRSKKSEKIVEEIVEPKEVESVTNGQDKPDKIEDTEGPTSSNKKSENKQSQIAASSETAATKTKRGSKRAAPSTNKKKSSKSTGEDGEGLDDGVDNTETEDDDSSKTKNKRSKTNSAPLNATATKYNKADFDLPPATDGEAAEEPRFNFKISSWNVAGLRSWLKKEGLKFLDYEQPDIFCMQETKCTNEQLPEEVVPIPGYHPYWLCMPGGYAGVAIYSKIMPINVEYGIGNKQFDDCGRIITAEYEKFFLVNVYVPNSGRKLVNLETRMKWEELFQQFIQNLDDRKPVVICGDMNVSHKENDLANPKTNTRNAGFTKEERDKMTELLALGYIDTFRHLYPERKGAYTFWTYMGNARSRNVGWRLDYFIVSERFIKRVVDNCIRSQCMGSDHCPITLFLKL